MIFTTTRIICDIMYKSMHEELKMNIILYRTTGFFELRPATLKKVPMAIMYETPPNIRLAIRNIYRA